MKSLYDHKLRLQPPMSRLPVWTAAWQNFIAQRCRHISLYRALTSCVR
jgi:hypothetical protein